MGKREIWTQIQPAFGASPGISPNAEIEPWLGRPNGPEIPRLFWPFERVDSWAMTGWLQHLPSGLALLLLMQPPVSPHVQILDLAILENVQVVSGMHVLAHALSLSSPPTCLSILSTACCACLCSPYHAIWCSFILVSRWCMLAVSSLACSSHFCLTMPHTCCSMYGAFLSMSSAMAV